MRTKIFYDAEFTGLQQSTGLISLALCAEDGRCFYAEFSDYDSSLCDSWINKHVLALTRWIIDPEAVPFTALQDTIQCCYGDSYAVKTALLQWLTCYDSIEIWADCLAWDWVLFCELFGGALQLPKAIFYMPFDLVTLFYCKGLDADISRVEFVKSHGIELDEGQLHNAMFDARLTQLCHDLLIKQF